MTCSFQTAVSAIAICAGLFYGIRRFLQGPIYKSSKRLDGKTALVTGASSGIGLVTARELCRRGARVLLLCRSEEKTRKAIGQIKNDLSGESKVGELVFQKLELSSLSSVRECATRIIATESRVDLLVLNAGIMMTPLQRTEDGFELQMGTNHLGHFLLTRLLVPLLKRTANSSADGDADVRVVVVSSSAHAIARTPIRLKDLNWFKESEYRPMEAYFQTKVANIQFASELGRRLEPSGITTYSLHPGIIASDLDRHAAVSSNLVTYVFYILSYYLCGSLIKTPTHGAQTTLYCCLDDSIRGVTGRYYSDMAPKEPSPFASNKEESKGLWELSERLTRCERIEI